MRRLAALTLLALLASTAAAHGASSVIPTRSTTIPNAWYAEGWPIAPKLMGERVAWADGTSSGTVQVWTGDPATRRVHRIETLRPSGYVGAFDLQPRLEASPTRLALSASMDEGGLDVAGAPGALRRVDGLWWDLDGDRLLIAVHGRNAVYLLDPATGERSADIALPDPAPEPESFAGARSLALAGDLLAYHQNREGAVMEWRTGRVLTRARTDAVGHVAGLQRDGTALWSEGVPWARERGPFSVTVPGGEQRPLPLPAGVVPLLGGDRVAYHDLARGAIVVADLTGREIGATVLTPDATASDLIPDYGVRPDAPRPVLSDFDGRRATWSYRPCAVALVAVWDVDAGPFEQPRPRCRAARLAGRVREDRDGHRVPLRCDAPRLTGCATRLTLRTRRGRILHTMRVDLPAGARRGIHVRGRATEARRLAVTTEPALRPEPGERRTWAVRVR